MALASETESERVALARNRESERVGLAHFRSNCAIYAADSSQPDWKAIRARRVLIG